MALVFIAFGANLSRPLDTLNRMELAFVRYIDKLQILNRSALYLSAPLADKLQPCYYNCVFSIKTNLVPLALLRFLKFFERNFGRSERYKQHWGPRSLDLDILLYDQLVIHTEELMIPHPLLLKRVFVRIPLLELFPTALETAHCRHVSLDDPADQGLLAPSSLHEIGGFKAEEKRWVLHNFSTANQCLLQIHSRNGAIETLGA